MAIVFSNNARTTLASNISNSATTITVADGSVFPSLTGGDIFYCTIDDGTNNEIVEVTAISGNTLTVVRAQDNTSANAFVSGDLVELRLVAKVLETFPQVDAGEVTADEFIGDLRGAVIFKAQAGEAVSKGDAVYVSGISGTTPVVALADADFASKMPAFGLILTAASANGSTEVVTFGTISGVDTSAFSVGDTLYVSTTAGALTNSKPTGEASLLQNIGKVQRSHATSGSIKVGGAGRTNDTPNLNDGNIFIGNASNQATTASLNTKIEDYLDANGLTLPDNVKAQFGAGNDLQIFHNGVASVIQDNGTGNLFIQGSSAVNITNVGSSETYASFNENGAVSLYYDNSSKLVTTSSGVNVNGTVVSDGLTVDGTGDFNIGTENIGIDVTSTDAGSYIRFNDNNATGFYLGTNAANFIILDTDNIAKLKIASNGDISFYEDTGTTAKLFWDASAEQLNIGDQHISQTSISSGDSTTSGNVRSYFSDGSYVDLKGYGLEFNRTTSYIRPTADGTTSLYFGSTDASLDWNTIHFRSNNGLFLNGTQFISAGLNLTNIGTIDSGAITAPSLQLGSDTQPTLSGDGNLLRIQTSSGYLDIGSNNAGFAHIQTDRAKFYFNKRILVDEGIISSYDEDLVLQRSSSTVATFTTTGATFAGTINSGAITVTSTVAGTTASTFSGNYSASGDVKLAVFERSGGAVASAIEYNDATTDMEFGTTTSHSFSLKTADTRRLTIDSSGNSTFTGTISSGAITSTGQFSVNTGATGTLAQFRGDDTDLLNIDGDSNAITLDARNVGAFNIEMQGTNALTIDNSQNATFSGTIFSGNITSSGFVTIDSATDGKLKLKTPSGESSDWNYIEFYGADDTRDGYVGTDADGDMKFFSDKNSSELRLESSGATISTNLTVTGDLTVNGTTTTVNQTNLDVSDNLIGLNRGASSNANDSGMLIERGSTGDNVFIGWDESSDKITFATTTNVPSDTGNLTLTAAPIQASSVGVTNIVTNKVVKFDGSILDDSNITDTGSLITLGSDSSIASGSLYADAQDNWVGINTTSDIGSVLNVLDVDGESVTLRLHTNTNSHNPVLRMNAKNSSGTQQYADIKYNPDSPSFNFHVPYNESTPTLKIADGSVTVDGTISSGAITSTGAITLNGSLGTWSVDNQGAIMNFTRATANYIKAGSTGGYLVFQTNGANTALTLDSSQNATFAGTIDSGDITTTGINIGTDSGDPFNSQSVIKIQDGGNAYIQIKAGTSAVGGILIGDVDDDYVGGMLYSNSSNALTFNSGNVLALTLDSSQNATFAGTINSGAITATSTIAYSPDVGGDLTLGNDGSYGTHTNGRYLTLGFGGTTNGYNRIFAGNTADAPLFINSATGRGIYFRTNGGSADSVIIDTTAGIRSRGQVRATGWYGSQSSDNNGMALEIGVSGSAPHILAYNRSTQSYGQLQTYAAGMTFDSRSNAFTITNSSHVQSDSDIRAAGSRVRIGNPTGLSGRSGIRIDTTGDAAADIVFGDNTSSTSWSNANWTLSSRSTSDNQVFRIYRGSGQPSPYNSEAVAVEIARDLNMTLAKGLALGSSSTLSIPSHSGIEIDITGSQAGNIRANDDLYLLSQTGTLNLGAGGTNSQISLATNGNATFTGNVALAKANPVLILNDTTASSNTDQVAYISFQDNGSEEAWVGWGSSGNTDLTIKNNIGSVVLDGTGTTVINDNLDLNGNADISGTLTAAGDITAGSGTLTVQATGYGGGQIGLGDWTNTNPIGISEGLWNSVTSDNDFVTVYARQHFNIRGYSGGTTHWLTLNSSALNLVQSQALQLNGTTVIDSSANITGNSLVRSNSRVASSHKYPPGHYSKGDQVFAIDPTWSESELRSFFNSTSVSWSAQSDAPGGYAVYINGSTSVGGVYGSGFGHIPIETGDLFYMECWIKNVGENTHYMGSNEFNEGFSSVGGNPGSFGYWVMSNTNPGSSWVKVSGYISNVSGTGTTTGQFDNGAKYWTPMALFNYTNPSGTRACYISGWKVYRVNRGSPLWITQSNRQDVTAADTISSYTGSVGSGWTPMALVDNNTKPGHPLVIKNSRSDYWSVGIDTHSYGIYARAYSANTRSILQGTDTAGNVVFDAGFDGDLAIGGDISMAGLYAGTWGPSSSSSVGRIGQVTDRVAGSITNQIGGSTSAKWEIVDYGWSAVLMQCDNSGNTYIGGSLGIGVTPDTSHSLKISSNDNEPVEIYGSGGGAWINIQSSTSQVMSQGVDTNGWAIYDRTNSAYRIRVANNGQLQTLQGIANSSSYSQTGGSFSTAGATEVRLTDGTERVRIQGYDLLGYGAGGNGLWVISNVTANASNQTTLTLGTEWDWDDSISFKYVPAASGSSGGVLTIGQDQKNSPSWNHDTTNFNFNGSTIFQFANTSRFEMRPTSSSGGERVYYAAGSYTANTSATFQDVRMVGTLPVDHKYVRDSSGNYGYKMEYWWDGDSYQNIRQQNDAFRFSTDVIAFDTSDKRLKNNITPIENCLDKVSKLGAYEFEWDETKQRRFKGFDTGVIAQEVEEVYPHMVETREDGYKALQYEKLVPLLLGAIKEQQEQIESLKSEVDNLKGEK